jgi:hypothetical protein
MAITYNTNLTNAGYIYRTTGGGVTFSANLAGTTTFDYFTDTAVTNDALYIANTTNTGFAWSDVTFNIGTALAGTSVTGVWEYSTGATTWATIPMMIDNTVGFTATGAQRLQFAYPVNWKTRTVNGISTKCWIRYRLTGGTVSEGGANSTSIPQVGDGVVNVAGYTVGAECTLNDIYTYMSTNYSYTTPIKNNNYYDFRWFAVSFDSPTISNNEVLELGFNMNGVQSGRNNWKFDYFTSGVLVGTNNGKRGSTFILNSVTNEYLLSFTTNCKFYGCKFFSNPSYNAGYFNFNGTFYDCSFQIAPGGLGTGDCSNNKFEIGFGFIAATWATTANNPFLNNKFLITGSSGWSCYSASFSINKPDITFDTGTKYLCSSQQNASPGIVWNFIDPSIPLPTISTTNKPMSNSRGTDADIPNVFYYDASAGTYTDYTTQAADATANDVPLPVDDGDCLYFNILAAATSLQHPSFTMATQTNDNAYVWEYYKTSAFKSFSAQWDETANLTKSGVVWFERAVSDITVLTVNGVSGYWYRLRLVTKGTTTNTATQIRRRTRGGCGTWKLNYQNSITYTAKDTSNNLLDGVEVEYVDTFGTAQFTGTTSSGVITPANVTTAQYRFDPLDAGRDTTNDTAETLYNPFMKRARKYGYIFSDSSVTISVPQLPVDVLSVNSYVDVDQATAHAYTGIDITGNTITISADHTMQEVYDWTQDWAVLNLAEDEPYSTTDGQTFYSTYDLVLDGCDLTGTGTISMVANSVTYLNGATSTVTIVADDGTHTNIKLTGLVAGSRVQLYDQDEDTELYNDIVTGTSLTFPYVWTEDLDIRVRVMFVDGVTAKKWYKTTGTFSVTGMTLNVVQEDDTVYNAIGIDGTTVTECEIVGTVLVVEVDDPDNTTSGQRIYAFEVAWLFTEAGIRDQALYIEATDMTHFTFLGGLTIKNMDTVNPLNITGANIVPSTGAATDVFDLSNGASIALNFNRVEGFSYSSGSGLSPEEHNALLAQKTTIDTNLDAKVSKALTKAKFLALK